MKLKILLATILSLAVLFSFGFFQNKADPVIGTVRDLIGTVTIKALDGSLRKSAINAQVYLDDTVTTAKESKITVVLGEQKATVTVGPDSSVKMSVIIGASKDKKTFLGILFGAVQLVVQSLTGNESFTLQTPNGTVSVRGTDFAVTVSDLSDTLVTVNDGTVGVEGQTTSASVTANQSCEVVPDQTPAVTHGNTDSDQWYQGKEDQLSVLGAVRLVTLGARLADFIIRLPDITRKINSILTSPDYLLIKGKKTIGFPLTPDEQWRFNNMRSSAEEVITNAYTFLNIMDSISAIQIRIAMKTNPNDPNNKKTIETATNQHNQIVAMIKQLRDLYAFFFL